MTWPVVHRDLVDDGDDGLIKWRLFRWCLSLEIPSKVCNSHQVSPVEPNALWMRVVLLLHLSTYPFYWPLRLPVGTLYSIIAQQMHSDASLTSLVFQCECVTDPSFSSWFILIYLLLFSLLLPLIDFTTAFLFECVCVCVWLADVSVYWVYSQCRILFT